MARKGKTIMGVGPHDRSRELAFGLAVGEILRSRYPTYPAKRIATDLSGVGPECSIRTAENILAGHLSAKTLTRLVRAYGLGFLIEAGARVTGKSLEAYVIEEAERARCEERNWGAQAARMDQLQARLVARDPALAPHRDSLGGSEA